MVCIHLRVPSCASWVSAFTNWGGMTWRHSWRGMRRRAGTATPDSLNCWRGIYKRYECKEEVLQTLPSPPSSLGGPTRRLFLTVWILQPQRFPWQDSPVYLILTPSAPESTPEAAAGTCHAWVQSFWAQKKASYIWQHGCHVPLQMTGTAMGTPAKADCVPWTWPKQESCLIA